jgi:hypothetical protein
MNLRHPETVADRLALAFAGGCLGLILGGLLSFLFHSWSVVWYTVAYFALVCFMLGSVAADIVVMVFNAIGVLFLGGMGAVVTSSGYDENPFNKPWHWALLAMFFLGFAGVLFFAKAV